MYLLPSTLMKIKAISKWNKIKVIEIKVE